MPADEQQKKLGKGYALVVKAGYDRICNAQRQHEKKADTHYDIESAAQPLLKVHQMGDGKVGGERKNHHIRYIDKKALAQIIPEGREKAGDKGAPVPAQGLDHRVVERTAGGTQRKYRQGADNPKYACQHQLADDIQTGEHHGPLGLLHFSVTSAKEPLLPS